MNIRIARQSWAVLMVLLAGVLTAWGQSGSNGVYGGYVGSSAWFDSMRESAANQAMLHSLQSGSGGPQGSVPPGYVEIAGVIHFTLRNPFPDGQLPDLYIKCANSAADRVGRSPVISTRQPAAPSFYTILKRGQTYNFSWIYYLGSRQQLGSWTVPANAPRQVRLVMNVDMKGNAFIEAMGVVENAAPAASPQPPSYPADQSRAGAYPPASSSYTPPTAAGGYTLPQSSGSYTPPQSDGAYTPPRSDGSYTPPQSDGAYTPPQSDGSYTPPQTDGAYKPPQAYPPAPGAYPPASPYPGTAGPIPGTVTPLPSQPSAYPGNTMPQTAVSGPPRLPAPLQAVSNRMRSLPAERPATPAPAPITAPAASAPGPHPSPAVSGVPAASSTLQVDPNQFDLGGLSTPPKNAQESALWKLILAATTPAQKAKAHQALSTYYQSRGNTKLSLREALRAQYWSAGGHW